MVIDLDGEESPDAWKKICDHHGYQPTSPWMSATGSGGTHLYYRVPPGATECKSGMIWGVWDTFGDDGKGRWAKHKEVRILGDNALVIAPPSVHVETGVRYKFRPGCSPREIRVPEVAPAWLAAMPRLSSPRFGDARAAAPTARLPERLSGKHYMRKEVLDAIGTDKLALLKGWGLRTERDHPNSAGWVACYVPWREDPDQSNPSGSLHYHDGTFQDRKDESSISMFDLAAILQPGLFPRWQDCRDYCGDRYIGRIRN